MAAFVRARLTLPLVCRVLTDAATWGNPTLEMDVPQGEGDDGQDQEQSAGHELFGLGQTHPEDNEEHGHNQVRQDPGNLRFKQTAGAKNETGSRE